MMGKAMRMVEHVKYVTAGADDVATKLCRLMPNVGEPRFSKRRAICAVVNSIIMYGAPIWSKATQKDRYRNMPIRVRRKMAIRISSAYRTVSTEAVQVMAGLIPPDLQIKERTASYNDPDSNQLRANKMEEWQRRWYNLARKAAWTRELISDVAEWRTGDMTR